MKASSSANCRFPSARKPSNRRDMATRVAVDPDYTGLTRVEDGLPSFWYHDPAHHERELRAIWYRDWVYVGRARSLDGPLAFRTVTIGDQNIILLRDETGPLRAFHNTCRHRGSVLCTRTEGRFEQKVIICPYHRWTYDLRGALVRTSSKTAGEGFHQSEYALYGVAVAEWRGFVFVNLAGREAVPFHGTFARTPERFDLWPLEDMVLGHSYRAELGCNWKVFWENFSECLHCPGVHPDLCRLVPIYGRGFMGAHDDPDWSSHAGDDDPRYQGGLARGAETWSRDARPIAPGSPGSSRGRYKPSSSACRRSTWSGMSTTCGRYGSFPWARSARNWSPTGTSPPPP